MPGNKSKTKLKTALEGRYARFKSKKRLRMIFVKTPGGRTTIQFKKRKPNKVKCSKCGQVLAGVPQKFPSQIKKIPKTRRRPERPYGGILCSTCTRALLKEKARIPR